MTDAIRAAAEEIANWLATAVRHNPTIDADTMHGTIAAIIQRRCSFAAGVEAAARLMDDAALWANDDIRSSFAGLGDKIRALKEDSHG